MVQPFVFFLGSQGQASHTLQNVSNSFTNSGRWIGESGFVLLVPSGILNSFLIFVQFDFFSQKCCDSREKCDVGALFVCLCVHESFFLPKKQSSLLLAVQHEIPATTLK